MTFLCSDGVPSLDGAGYYCPWEWNTVKAMKVMAEFLAKSIDYDVPPQDFAYSMVEIPSRPKSGMVFENVC